MKKDRLTTASGIPVAQNQHSQTAGERGPVLIQDLQLIEKLAHFNRERIPERVVHAKGFGAYGKFTVTNDITKYSCAKIFENVGKETELFARFSTVAGEKGYADTDRDPRGFAVKFYTDDGIWDLVGNNTPVFFERDPLKFPDFIHTQKRDPETGRKDPRRMWHYWSLSPENMHQLMILFSDRGLPDGFRHMNGYGSHTFSLWNKDKERFWVKFHFKTDQGIKNLMPEEAEKLAGTNPDYAGEDLFKAIEQENFPKWNVKIQVVPEEEAEQFDFNPFDLTKVWPHGKYPLIDVGVMELNRNPENYFAEVEQVAFSPNNMPPGIGASPDKMLQGRLFAYGDAHRYRLGSNYQSLPVNKSKSEVNTYQRDGKMRFDGNYGSMDNYEPNDFNGPTENNDLTEPPLKISGNVDHYNSHKGNDDYSQAGDLYRLFTEDQKDRIAQNIAASLGSSSKEVQQRMIGHFEKCDQDLGTRLTKELNDH
tara:strand:+ start:216597 stop:218033 length:1437 start_codon:yes stop_codon:yes gene_type:complete